MEGEIWLSARLIDLDPHDDRAMKMLDEISSSDANRIPSETKRSFDSAGSRKNPKEILNCLEIII